MEKPKIDLSKYPGQRQLIEACLKDPAGVMKKVQTLRCAQEKGLIYFLKLFWQYVEPVRPFVPGWHIDAICEHLEAVTAGQIKRLLINVPPGHAKPISKEELIQMADGSRKKLGDIGVGDLIINGKGKVTEVTAVHEQGLLRCLQIKTESGRQIVAAPDHPFLTPEGWVNAGDLSLGQSLALLGARQYVPDKDIHDSSEFILSGFLIGDGSVTIGKGGLSCEICSVDDDNIDQASKAAVALGFDCKIYRPNKAKCGDKDFRRLMFSGGARDWIRGIKLAGKSSYTKIVPDFVFKGTNNQIAMFIATYFQCDGCVENHSAKHIKYVASFGSVSKELLLGVSSLLLRLGILSRVRTNVLKNQTGKMPIGYTTHRIRIGGTDGINRFFERVPVIGPKQRKHSGKVPFKESFCDQEIFPDKIELIEDAGLADCRCLTVNDGHSFIANDFIVHNSLITNVAYPAWEWGPKNMPTMRYMCISYSQELTIRDNTRFRWIITSDDYTSRWPNVVPSKEQFSLTMTGNNLTGFKLATSVGGISTGMRADRLILDDPNSVRDAESDKVRDSTNTYFSEILPTRLNDPKESAIIVIQQRTHEEDVSGTILTKDLGYDHLCLPARFDSTRRCVTSIGWKDPRGTDENGNEIDNDGAILWSGMYPEEEVRKLEVALGPYAASAQLMQLPVPRGGAIFDRDWWKPWPISPEGKIHFPPFDYVIASVDTAFTEKEENDYSAMTVWGVWRQDGESFVAPKDVDDPANTIRIMQDLRPKVMLMTGWQKRLSLHGPPDDRPYHISSEEWNSPYWTKERQKSWGLVEWVVHTARKYRIDKLLIETQAAGHTLSQELRRLHDTGEWDVQMIVARGDKKARAISVQHLFSNGLIYVPTYEDGRLPSWADTIVTQFSSFPRTRHKDIVDTGTHALQHLRDVGILVRRDEFDEQFQDELQYRTPDKPLYDV